ncbi:ABC transporter permease [Pelagicoccus sp. SDUM812005]|uniref:ABC transporter permease n=1 Tax=Pelagicoccus sp. SDUM812005 TaxID=3041257 RepID=UPI00280E7028|nr:ABC transporter permease [Pelagicoccus sp. SDUM812005]MDQ8179596.1 ABC transporter permease [Pelagicoccus sp. SDUM812005]
MTAWRIALKGLRSRVLSSSVTAGSLALSVCLLLLVWGFKAEAERSFAAADGGFDAVLGPRGSKLQIVLNALYHLDESPGLLRWSDYEQIKSNPMVAAAYPIAVGDNYQGIRLVGTVSEYLTQHEFREGQGFAIAGSGRVFSEGQLEAVVGSQAAKQLKLKVGDTFHPYHGLQYDANARHEELYTVVGVLEPTGTPGDRVIWIPVAGVQNMSGHAAAAANSVSAVLVAFKPGARTAGFQLDMLYNRRGDRLTLAWPASQSVLRLFEKLSWFDLALRGIAVLVALIAAAGVTATLYNAMSERRRDIAVWRALGARRRVVFAIATMESLGISLCGLALGACLYLVSGYALAAVAREKAGVMLELFAPNAAFLWVPLGVLAIGFLAGLAPAVKAYRVDVTKDL